MKAKICGIYKIENVISGDCYIGHSRDIKKRWSWHKARLRKNKHRYKILQDAWNKDENNIKFEILEECSIDELKEREIYYINYCKRVGWNVLNKNKVQESKLRTDDQKKGFRQSQKWDKNGNAKLTLEQMKELKKMAIESPKTLKEIADLFGVCITHVCNIKHGKRLKWLRVDN